MKATFLRVIEADDKDQALRRLIASTGAAGRYEVDLASLAGLPKAPFGYWVGEGIRSAYLRLAPFQSDGRTAQFGPSTKNDPRYLRAQWEISSTAIGSSRDASYLHPWARLLKGGAFSPYYADPHLVIGWGSDGWELKADISEYRGSHGWGYQWTAALNGHDHYFRPGLSWPRRTNGLSFRAMPEGCIFADKGPAAFEAGDGSLALLALLAVTNSEPFMILVSLQLARTELAQSYEVGVIQRTPVPDLSPADESALAALAQRAWSLKRGLDTRTETSHAFILPALLQVPGAALAARAAAWTAQVRMTDEELADIQTQIDERCFALYAIGEEDRRSITGGVGDSPAGVEGSDTDGAAEDDEAADDVEAEIDTANTATLAAELASWALGVAFGRFDVRLATGARELPGEPGPFDPLPVCSPATLTGSDGLPLDAPPAGYPLSFPADGILVDDPGHQRDLTHAVRSVFDVVFDAGADAAWQEAGALLDPKGNDVSTWLRAGFFEHHLRRHSKSRRKAPIVWQLGAPSGRYGIFAYAHRLTRDSLFVIQNDIVGPRLAVEERRLASLRTQAATSPSAHERAEIDAAELAVEETRAFIAELRRVAPLWNPDLDDGVVLVSAPLWRLVPGHKPWQKELRSRWDELAVGKYDWAHLAMHLWPERVVPKCATDRSLAIAHGLEDVFWAEGADGKWVKRGWPTRSVEDLVAERTSPAVKAALADLQGAPALAAGARGPGRNT